MNIRKKLGEFLLGYNPDDYSQPKIVEKIEIVPEGTLDKQPIFCLQQPDLEARYYGYKDVAYVLHLGDALEWKRKNPDRHAIRVIEGYVRGDKFYLTTAQQGRSLTDPKNLPE